ncbi:hypothetical protein [Rhizobium sp. LjRoot258]|jgi:hypothetical protein|uniref:hypothetical protein n=1 Tax=Rhizobium sp. LjRoot258 TaxID=3342299 RepID=UPI003ECF94BC
MDNLEPLLSQEYEKYLSLIVSTRRRDQRWLEGDETTGRELDVTDARLTNLEETARLLVRMMNEIGASDQLFASRPTKDWHFS